MCGVMWWQSSSIHPSSIYTIHRYSVPAAKQENGEHVERGRLGARSPPYHIPAKTRPSTASLGIIVTSPAHIAWISNIVLGESCDTSKSTINNTAKSNLTCNVVKSSAWNASNGIIRVSLTVTHVCCCRQRTAREGGRQEGVSWCLQRARLPVTSTHDCRFPLIARHLAACFRSYGDMGESRLVLLTFDFLLSCMILVCSRIFDICRGFFLLVFIHDACFCVVLPFVPFCYHDIPFGGWVRT